MVCEHPKEEWTISTVTDISEAKGLLVFCLSIDGTAITGEVTEVPVDSEGNVNGDPVFLSDTVTGTDDPIGGDNNLSLMTLNFPWGNTRVMMAGVRFRSATPNTFRGRFSAFATVELAKAAAVAAPSDATVTPLAPGDGDTGTGTGTQT